MTTFLYFFKHFLISGFILIFTASLSYPGETIFAVRSSGIEPYRSALNGFREALEANGANARLSVYDLAGDEGRWKEVLGKIREERPRLIVTFGTLATELARMDVKDTPIVFSSVLNPEDSGLISSLSSPGGNITGASLDIDADTQFSYILRMLPAAKKVGVLYNPKETGLTVERAKAAASAMGLSLIAEPVGNETSLPRAIDRLLPQIDVLWSVADSTIFSPPAVQQIIVEAIKHRLPFMGLSPSFVKAGALFSVRWDDTDIGRQAGEAALRILSLDSYPSGIPVTTPRHISISVNMRTARSIGITVPAGMLKGAEVFR